MNAGICDFQLSFGEANFTWRNDITSKNVLNRPICDEINKHCLSHPRNLFNPCSKKADFAFRNQNV